MAEQRTARRTARALGTAALALVTGATALVGAFSATAGAVEVPALSLSPDHVREDSEAASRPISLHFAESRWGAGLGVRVAIRAADTTATRGEDYSSPVAPGESMSVTLAANATDVELPIRVLDDRVSDAGERIVVVVQQITTADDRSAYPDQALTLAIDDLEWNISVQPLDQTIALGDPIPTSFPRRVVANDRGPVDLSLLQGLPCGTTATAASPAGDYPITCSEALSPFYAPMISSITSVAGTLHVRPRLRTIAPSPSVFQGQPIPALIPTYDSGGTPVLAPATPATCSTTATSASPVGRYPVTCTTPGDPRFGAFDATPGTLEILPNVPTTTVASPILLRLAPTKLTLGTVTARLATATGPVVGQPVRFTAGGAAVCTAVTDARGIATCTANVAGLVRLLLAGRVTATYDGRPGLLPSSGAAALVG